MVQPNHSIFHNSAHRMAAFSLLIGTLLVLLFSVQPRFTHTTYQLADGEKQDFTLPLQFDSDDTDFTVELSFILAPLHTSLFLVSADDCIQSIEINHITLEDSQLPYCNLDRPLNIQVRPFVHTGQNTMVIRAHNNGGPGGFSFRAAPSDNMFLALWMCTTLVLCFIIWWFVTHMYTGKYAAILTGILCIGVLVRIVYMLSTPFDVRGYDTGGHIEYMEYLAENLSLPGPGDGWQWYQPPLYYSVGGMLFYFQGSIAHLISPISALQFVALLSSIAVLLTTVWIAFTAFPKKHREASLLMIGIVAAFPTLVFFAARINNDVFYHLFGALCLGSLFAWWQREGMKLWYISIICVSLAMLSKMNALLFLPIIFGCLLLKWDMRITEKIRHTLLGLLTLSALTEWFFALRMIIDKQSSLVGNVGNLHSGLLLQNTFAHLTTFNPIRILETTFNNPWNDDARRQFFWEYLFRSSLFGEFTFPDSMYHLTLSLSILGLLLLLITAIGVFYSVRTQFYKDLPLLATLGILLLGHLLFRIKYPYSSSQDFRYSILLVIPVSYFIALAVERMPMQFRKVASSIAVLFCAASTIFLLSIS